jgi:anti-sigma factor RsiW
MHPNEETLNAYADGSLPATEAAEIERHVASCVSCRQLVDDLREIRRATADLDLQDPPARAWMRIERAIQLEGEGARAEGARALQASDADAHEGARGFQPSGGAGARLKGSRSSGLWLAAAAALVLATVVGLRYAPGRSQVAAPASPASDGAAQASAGDAAQSVENELRQAEAHYENAIKGLEQIANAEQNALDPRTAATLQKNLAVIDQAINESRAAIRSQPASEPAQQSLVENFKTKIALLQDTVALINEMRKGNEAGAARIVSGLKQKGN